MCLRTGTSAAMRSGSGRVARAVDGRAAAGVVLGGRDFTLVSAEAPAGVSLRKNTTATVRTRATPTTRPSLASLGMGADLRQRTGARWEPSVAGNALLVTNYQPRIAAASAFWRENVHFCESSRGRGGNRGR